MSLPGLMQRGIDVVLRSAGADEELRALVAAAGHELDAVEHVQQTLEAMPGLLAAVTRDLTTADVSVRRLFHAVVDYLIQEENLIPSHAGKPLRVIFAAPHERKARHCLDHYRDRLRTIELVPLARRRKDIPHLLQFE